MSTRDGHSVQQARSVVEQLRRERNLRRTTISQTATDLVRYAYTFSNYKLHRNYRRGIVFDVRNVFSAGI